MKTLIVKKGEELEAARILSNRTDDDFDAVDATVKEVIAFFPGVLWLLKKSFG